MNEVWMIEDALALVRALQPEVRRFGYHVALGGGVLNQGLSYKDLDLYFLPLENQEISGGVGRWDELINYLEDLWGPSQDISGKMYPRSESMMPKEEPRKDQVESFWSQAPSPPSPPEPALEAPYERTTAYAHKLKFMRGDGDRIDVFIVG